jgi:CBS-domain-containing membrane protein
MNLSSLGTSIAHWLGIERNQTSHGEKLLSALGAFIAISFTVLLSMTISMHFGFSNTASLLIISSMGASAVLLFAVPHGVLSQPWPVIGGHLISALIGIACQQWLPSGFLTAGLAVGLSVGAMYYLRCIHPPGGASALTAVVGGSEVYDMGFTFLLYPILLNVLVMLTVAVSFNLLFHWRRYPAHLAVRHHVDDSVPVPISDYVLTTEDFHAAISELDSFVDIGEEGLTELLETARRHAQATVAHPDTIQKGAYYSNGNIGHLWSIRHVIDDAGLDNKGRDLIIYKTVAGAGAYETGYCDRETFRLWARFEVIEQNRLWVKRTQFEQVS